MQKRYITIYLGRIITACAIACLGLSVTGCSPHLSSPEELEEFNDIGPVTSVSDLGYPTETFGYSGPYRVIPGDVLEFQMPAVLRVLSSDLPEWLRPTYGRTEAEPYLVRVSSSGVITLPIIGEMEVGGKTLAQIEATVIDAYFPRYVVSRPMVVCEVQKYQRESERVFAVMGLVNKPGIFPYPADVQYNL
ncbi:polysaccharide biosynthesis/export family protein, partial [Planctomycetota bacterium]